MQALPEAITAYNALTGWHLVGFILLVIALARPEWVASGWRKVMRRPAPKDASAIAAAQRAQATADAVKKELQKHEDGCERRQRETQDQIDRRFAAVDRRFDQMHNDMAEMRGEIASAKSAFGVMDGKIDTLVEWVKSK